MNHKNALVAAIICLSIELSGCASAPPKAYIQENLGFYAPMYPVIHAYSRNVAVCAPTMVGNVVGGLLASPFLLLAWPLAPEEGHAPGFGFKIVQAFFQTPVYIGGAITGTLFLPLSYAFPEDECHYHFQMGS